MMFRHFSPSGLIRHGTALAGLALGLFATAVLRADEPPAPATPPADPSVVAPAPVPAEPAVEAAPAPTPAVEAPAPAAPASAAEPAKTEWVNRGEVVSVGSSAVLAENERADEFVVVGGNAEIFGRVDGDVLVVFGNLKLGPNAQISGDVVTVLGAIDNPHHKRIKGDTIAVGGFVPYPAWGSLWAWMADASSHTRLLSPSVAWPWTVFGVISVFLLLLAVVFGRGVNACASSLEERPAAVLGTALGLLPGLPLFTLLLICTVLGILLLPFLWVALLFGVAFGKAAMLVFLGRAVLRVGGANELAERAWVTVLIGMALLAVLYCVPVIGILVWALTGWIGLGMVVATLLEKRRREKVAAASAAASAAAATAPPAKPAVSAGPAVAPAAVADDVAVSAFVEPAPAASAFVPVPPVVEPPLVAGVAQPPPSVAPLPAPVPVVIGPMNRADFWIRLGALLVDIVLVAIVGGTTLVLGALPFPLLFGAYMFGMWLWKGSSVGGIIFKLKVVRVDGRPIDAATSVVRTLVAFLSAVTLVGFLWCLWDDEGQTWHDKVAGTNVVRLPKSMSLV